MKKEELYDAIEGIDERFINEAETVRIKKYLWMRWAVAAACLCLIVVGAMRPSLFRKDRKTVQKWSQSFSAEDYFNNSNKGNSSNSSSSAKPVVPPYAVSVSINDKRTELENEGILPIMPSHSDQSFEVAYNDDGSLYKVTFWWIRRDEKGLNGYSDLKIIVSPEEIHEISDDVSVQIDEDGNITPDNVTVTERDGIHVYAEGRKNGEKIISWHTHDNWYKIVGSWNDTYEDMVYLLDWFWEHPLDLTIFESADGRLTSVWLKDVYTRRIR